MFEEYGHAQTMHLASRRRGNVSAMVITSVIIYCLKRTQAFCKVLNNSIFLQEMESVHIPNFVTGKEKNSV